MISESWEPEPEASFVRRLGISPQTPGSGRGGEDKATGGINECPDIWELSNGDVAMIGRDLTEVYRARLPDGVRIGPAERLVILPRGMIIAAKADIPDA
jgi:hypothetical protein